MNWSRYLLPLLAAFALCDGHWVAMQVFTWGEMAVHARNGGDKAVLEAIHDSLIGAETCPRCCRIEEERSRESERAIEWESKWIGAPWRGDGSGMAPGRPCFGRIGFASSADSRADAPPIPPPRAAGFFS